MKPISFSKRIVVRTIFSSSILQSLLSFFMCITILSRCLKFFVVYHICLGNILGAHVNLNSSYVSHYFANKVCRKWLELSSTIYILFVYNKTLSIIIFLFSLEKRGFGVLGSPQPQNPIFIDENCKVKNHCYLRLKAQTSTSMGWNLVLPGIILDILFF